MNDTRTATKSEVPIAAIQIDQRIWLTLKEAAAYLGKTANAMRIMARKGYLRPRKLRSRIYFSRLEIDRLIEFST
jgi:hypothetical protein